jgi:hypothetical protein
MRLERASMRNGARVALVLSRHGALRASVLRPCGSGHLGLPLISSRIRSPGPSLPASSRSGNASVSAGRGGEHMSAASRAFELRVGVAVDAQVAAVGETGDQADEQAATLPQAPARAT